MASSLGGSGLSTEIKEPLLANYKNLCLQIIFYVAESELGVHIVTGDIGVGLKSTPDLNIKILNSVTAVIVEKDSGTRKIMVNVTKIHFMFIFDRF